LHLETPQLVALILVLIMGVGNYCGTRYTLAALLYGLAVALSVLCMSTAAPACLADRALVRSVSLSLLILAGLSMMFSRRRPVATEFDLLWFDFFDLFGIVWGRRIQDRINYLADKEGLPVRLELDGFVWSDRAPLASTELMPDRPKIKTAIEQLNDRDGPSQACKARVEHLLRWLLRRFVDSPWIDVRMGRKSDQKITELAVDS
jgi:hypothetical protein